MAVPSQDDADALPMIARKSGIPVIADIHFQPKYVFAALDAGCAGVRVNPGNIKQFDDKVGEIARAARDTGTPIRIGVNAGSLDKRLLDKYGKATPEALAESALWEASLFEEHDFRDIKISVKHHDPVVMMTAYMQLAEQCDYPLHLGVTEAGPMPMGGVKSAVGIGTLLAEGIGDTIRVSLTPQPGGDRSEEVLVAQQVLQSLGLRSFVPQVSACPGCGRTTSTFFQVMAERIGSYLREQMPVWSARYPGVARPCAGTPAGSSTQSCRLSQKMCRCGRTEEVSSSVPALTITSPGSSPISLRIGEPQSGQNRRRTSRPLSARGRRSRHSCSIRVASVSSCLSRRAERS